jgi:ATP-dependent protease ClpP protease subunit
MSKQRWFEVRNSTDTEAEIYLYDEIGFWGMGAKEFIRALREHTGKHIHLRINSPGGEVIEGTAIANALSRHVGGVTVHIDALAASMASVIAMSGNPIFMADNALMMIHNPYMFAAGGSEDLRKSADLLDTMKSSLVRAYVKKTGLPESEIEEMMTAETWMDSTTAVALGFVDAIEDGVQAAAKVTLQDAKARFDKFAKGMAENTNSESAPETLEVAPEVTPEVVEVETLEEAPADVEPEVEEEAPTEPEVIPDIGAVPVNIAEFSSKVSALMVERDGFKARAELAEAKLSKANEEIAKVSDHLNKLEASKGLASASIVPSAVIPSDSAKTLTRADFDALPIDQKNSFFANGGKLAS